MKTSSLLIIILILANSPLHADWAEIGAVSRCDTERKLFSLYPVVETSSSGYDYKAPTGFTRFKHGKNQSYKCKLGDTLIEMEISVSGPQAQGMGQGSGVIFISELLIDGKHLIDKPTNFNWQVINERVLTRIRIKKVGVRIMTELCYSDGWDWFSPYWELQCSKEPNQ